MPEIFEDYYCVASKKPIKPEETKPQTPAVIGHVRYVNILTWLRGFLGQTSMLWRWINQHDTSVGQRKILSPRQESNPWPPEHRAGALSTELRELMESKDI